MAWPVVKVVQCRCACVCCARVLRACVGVCRCGESLGSCSIAIPNVGNINLVGEPLIHTADEIWRFFRYRSLPPALAPASPSN